MIEPQEVAKCKVCKVSLTSEHVYDDPGGLSTTYKCPVCFTLRRVSKRALQDPDNHQPA